MSRDTRGAVTTNCGWYFSTMLLSLAATAFSLTVAIEGSAWSLIPAGINMLWAGYFFNRLLDALTKRAAALVEALASSARHPRDAQR